MVRWSNAPVKLLNELADKLLATLNE